MNARISAPVATRALVAGCVRSLGCEALEAKDGDEAWQMVQGRRFDLIVLDVMMPGMSGWEVCRRIKSGTNTVRGGVPKVLMLTGIGEHAHRLHGVALFELGHSLLQSEFRLFARFTRGFQRRENDLVAVAIHANCLVQFLQH